MVIERKATRERVQLTDRKVKGLQPGEANYTVWDEEARGLGVQVTPAGVRSFVAKVTKDGRSWWITIGAFPAWTVEQARAKVREIRHQIDQGEDPKTSSKNDLSLGKFLAAHLDDHVKAFRKEVTFDAYEELLKKHVYPKALAKVKAKKVTRAQIEALMKEMASTPYAANRVLAIIRAAYRKRLPELPNPCSAVEKYTEHKRTNYLDMNALERLSVALQEVEDQYPYQVALTRLLLLTGARLREILHCRWSAASGGDPQHPYFDKARAMIVATDHKGSRKQGPKDILLSQVAMEIIEGLSKRKAGPYIFPAANDPKKPMTNPHHFWLTITDKRGKKPTVRQGLRDRAGLPNLRFHDLRHSFGALSTTLGQHPVVLSKLLGHASPQTTLNVYSHADLNPRRKAVEEIGAALGQTLSKK